MQPEPNQPPLLPTLPTAANVPPQLPLTSTTQPSSLRSLLGAVLGLFVGLFFADAMVSLADDSLICFANTNALSTFRFLLGFVTLLAVILVYVLMAFVPAIPKKIFVPLALFCPVTTLLAIPLAIYYFEKIQWLAWLTSALQVILILWVLYRLRGTLKPGWPLVPARWLTGDGFRWRNLIVFGLANICGLLPAVLIFLFFCATLAVNHFSDGFMTLYPGGLSMQARKYVRADGKTIQLFPMSHVAEADFYQNISRTFATNSIILMEGVTDEDNLLTNKISYKRMAQSLGLAEQHAEFKPHQGKVVRADIDVNQFSSNTIALLNLVMLIHGQGMNATNVQELLGYSPTPNFQAELFADLLGKRNQHLLAEIRSHLSQTDDIIVPWGMAHMPGIAKEIQKNGFQLQQSNDYTVIRFFHSAGKPHPSAKP